MHKKKTNSLTEYFGELVIAIAWVNEHKWRHRFLFTSSHVWNIMASPSFWQHWNDVKRKIIFQIVKKYAKVLCKISSSNIKGQNALKTCAKALHDVFFSKTTISMPFHGHLNFFSFYFYFILIVTLLKVINLLIHAVQSWSAVYAFQAVNFDQNL